MIAYLIYLVVITIQWGLICGTKRVITNRCKKNFLIVLLK